MGRPLENIVQNEQLRLERLALVPDPYIFYRQIYSDIGVNIPVSLSTIKSMFIKIWDFIKVYRFTFP